MTNSERWREKSFVYTKSEPAAEKAAMNLPFGAGTIRVNGPVESN